MAVHTIYRKNYKEPEFDIKSINLNVDLFEDHALITNTMDVNMHKNSPFVLYGEKLELLSIKLNNEELKKNAYKLTDAGLTIKNPPQKFTLEIQNNIKPQENTELSGLYRSNTIFCTQCEAEGFRRITFFPDRPDVLTIYTTRITADKNKYPHLLSNGNLIDKGDIANGRHFVVWHDPFKKPSYLFALVAGDLALVKDKFTTMSGKDVELCLYVEPGNEAKCDYALKSLKEAMRWDEREYGREYDLDIYMIVAVSDFNMGAMENKGLNIFNDKYVLASTKTATDDDYINIKGVIGHEYFHNWSGNRVTVRDWFQLSLKEGFTIFRDQEFTRDMISRDVCRIEDVKILRNHQFPEDAGTMSHPVRPDSYQEINNFYTTTVYNKGAEVIRMQQTLIGKEGFRKAMDLYFSENDGKAVTIDDFVSCVERANKVDLTQFKLWYSQAGTPKLSIKSSYNEAKQQLTLKIKQELKKTENKPFHIPVKIALFSKDGKKFKTDSDLLEIREEQEEFIFDNIPEQPVVSILQDFSAPILVDFEQSPQELETLMRFETDGFAKWNAGLTLAVNYLQNAYFDKATKDTLNQLIEAYRYILNDDKLDKSLIALMLSPPGFQDVALNIKDLDVIKLENVRESFKVAIGEALYKDLLKKYKKLQELEDNKVNKEAFQRRKLKNTLLMYLMKADESKSINLSEAQFYKAENMTDESSSFALLVNIKNEELRQKVIKDFYNKWQHDDLVLDKWLATQAFSEAENTLSNVRELLLSPAFNITNPNKCRSLIGTFCMANYRHFHAEDGSGYEFLTEMLLKIDKINPQVAARLATPFTRYTHLDKPRRNLIKKQLKELAKHTLSRDLNEIVSKSL